MSGLAVKILKEVKAVGGVVELLPPDRLHVSAPRNLVEQVKAHKPEILHFLMAHSLPLNEDDAKVDFEERAAIIQHGTGLPRTWAEAFAALCCGIDRNDRFMQQVLDDAGRFLDDWGKQESVMLWRPEWMFGHTPNFPPLSGLVWCIGGGRVAAATHDTVKIRSASGCIVTCRLNLDVFSNGCFWRTTD